MTNTFQEFVCWDDESVIAASPRDAASLTDAHFQAIHHPLRLRRRRLDQREGGAWASEADVLTALKGPLRPDGYLFIPVVGGSGTGKSHLVRWVKDQTEDEANWESRYLPKNRTGLRRAIEIIIRDLSGPRIDEARQALLEAPAHTESDSVLADRLLDELALIIAHLDQFQTSEQQDERASMLRSKLSRSLPDLLHDPVVRRRLVADGAVIQRLVGLALRGRQDGDGLDDDATRFLDSDFPLSFEDIGDATTGAKDLLRKIASIPQYRSESAAMINEALPAAEKRVAVSNQVDLVEVFREIRRTLHSQKKQLVLFVEDFTVLHGVEREFLDAIVEPTHSLDGEMCSLRMVFAITEGHFDDLDTVRTRCDDAYWLDANYGDDGVDQDEAISFVARYFNASRLTPREIESSWAQRTPGELNWLKNACTNCIHQETCHDVFGTSKEGYGLYPLNANAIGRFVHSLSAERFDPRDVVREIINRFLIQSSIDMTSSSFPESSTVDNFDNNNDPMQPVVAARIRSLRPADHSRISNILRFWSDSDGYYSVGGPILDAFGVGDFAEGLQSLLHEMAGQSEGATPPVRRRQETGAGIVQKGADSDGLIRDRAEDRLKPASRRYFDELTSWSTSSRELSAKTTQDLRRAIVAAIKLNLELGALPVNLGAFDDSRFSERDIVISGTVTHQDSSNSLILIERSIENAASLQALVLLNELGADGWPLCEYYRRILASMLESWTDMVANRLASASTADVAATVRAAVMVSAILGDLGRNPEVPAYISAIFAPARTRLPTPNRSAKWTALAAKANELKPQLLTRIEATFGESRGKQGGVRMVKADLLLPLVKDFAATWATDSTDASTASFFRAVMPAVDDEWATLESRVMFASELIDLNRSWGEQTSKILGTLRTAHQIGRLEDGEAFQSMTRLAAIEPARSLDSFMDVAAVLRKPVAMHDKLAILASETPDHVWVVYRFTQMADNSIKHVLRSLATRQSDVDDVNDLELATGRVLTSTRRFDETIVRLSR